MSSVTRTAGTAGTFTYQLSQTPASAPVMTIYSDLGRTVVAVPAATLAATGHPAIFTATYPATLAAGTYFLSFSTVMAAGQGAFVDNDDTLVLVAVSGDVGNHYVTLAEIRAQENLSDTAKYTDAKLAAARDWFEQEFERYTGRAFVVRQTTETLDGNGTNTLWVDNIPLRSLVSLTVDGVAVATTGWAPYPEGRIVRTAGAFVRGNRNVVVTYEHGTSPTPEPVRRAAFIAIRSALLGDQAGRTVYAVQTEAGIVRNSVPDWDAGRPFGIPDVDAVANAYRSRVPAVA